MVRHQDVSVMSYLKFIFSVATGFTWLSPRRFQSLLLYVQLYQGLAPETSASSFNFSWNMKMKKFTTVATT